MEPITVRMTHKKSTKGTEVYAAPEAVISTLYISKEAFSGKPPGTIKLEVRSGD